MTLLKRTILISWLLLLFTNTVAGQTDSLDNTLNNDPIIQYYDDGNIKFHFDKKMVQYTWWYRNGQIKEIRTGIGFSIKQQEKWYSNGQKKSNGFKYWVTDTVGTKIWLKQGKWSYWDENGVFIREEYWKEGKLVRITEKDYSGEAKNVTIEIEHIKTKWRKPPRLVSYTNLKLENHTRSSCWVILPSGTDNSLADTTSMLNNVKEMIPCRDKGAKRYLEVYENVGSYLIYYLEPNEKVSIRDWTINSREAVAPFSVHVMEDLLLEEGNGTDTKSYRSITELELYQFLTDSKWWRKNNTRGKNKYEPSTSFNLHFKNVIRIAYFDFGDVLKK